MTGRRSGGQGTTRGGTNPTNLPPERPSFSRAIADLMADPANLRTHDERNISAIMNSLKRFGQQKPIVIDAQDVVRAGNGTLEAARRIGWESIDVVVTDLEGADAVAFGIADNRTAELAAWDSPALALTLPTFDPGLLEAAGFDNDELSHLLNKMDPPVVGGNTDADDLPATPSKPRSKAGDVWLLGDHRLVVGDCRDLDLVHTLMDGGRADCMWTDPPYGVEVVGGDTMTSKATRRAAGGKSIDNDTPADMPTLLVTAWKVANEALRPGAPWYIAHAAGALSHEVQQTVLTARWDWSQTLIWVKHRIVPGHSDYHYQHEPILYGFTKLAPGNGRRGRGSKRWYGDNAQASVFQVPRPARSEDHPTMKPVDLIVAMLKNSTGPNGVVYDPFAGSGSTLIAAHTIGRRARLIELNTGYADVICRRYQEFADDLPVHAGTGKAVDFARR